MSTVKTSKGGASPKVRRRIGIAAIVMIVMAALVCGAVAYAAFSASDVKWSNKMPYKDIDSSKVGVVLDNNALTKIGQMENRTRSGDVIWDGTNRLFSIPTGGQEGEFSFCIRDAGYYIWTDDTIDLKLTCHVKLTKPVPAKKDDVPDDVRPRHADGTPYERYEDGIIDVYRFDTAAMGEGQNTYRSERLGYKEDWTVRLYKHDDDPAKRYVTEVTNKWFIFQVRDMDVYSNIGDKLDVDDLVYTSEYSEGIELTDTTNCDLDSVTLGTKMDPYKERHLNNKGTGKEYTTAALNVGTFPDTSHLWIHSSHSCFESNRDSAAAMLVKSGFKFTWRGQNCASRLNITGAPLPELKNLTKTPTRQIRTIGDTSKPPTFESEFLLPHVGGPENAFTKLVWSDKLDKCLDLASAKSSCKVYKKVDGSWVNVTSNWKVTTDTSTNTLKATAQDTTDPGGAVGQHKVVFSATLRSDYDYSNLSNSTIPTDLANVTNGSSYTAIAGWACKKFDNTADLYGEFVDDDTSIEDPYAVTLYTDPVTVYVPMYANLDLMLTKTDTEFEKVRTGQLPKTGYDDSWTNPPEGDATLQGAEFQVYYYTDQALTHTGESGYKAMATFTSGDGGTVKFGSGTASWPYRVNNVNVLPLGSYYVKETKAPKGYNLNSAGYFRMLVSGGTGGAALKQYNASGTAITTGTLRVTNDVIRGAVKIRKVDADAYADDPGTAYDAGPQGDAHFHGATFSVINKNANPVYIDGKTAATNEVCAEMQSHGDDMTLTGIPYGTYEIVETESGLLQGYDSNGTWKATFTISSSDTIDLTGSPVADPVWRGGMEFIKGDLDLVNMVYEPEPGYEADSGQKPNVGEGNATLEGAEYKIKNASESYVYVNGRKYGKGDVIEGLTLVTDVRGYAATGTDTLPYGTYVLYETKAPYGYLLSDDEFEFKVREKGKVVHVGKIATP